MRKRHAKRSTVVLIAIGAVMFLPSMVGTGHADTCGGALNVSGTNCVSVGNVVLVSSPSETHGCATDTGCVSQKPGEAPQFKPQPAPVAAKPRPAVRKPEPVHAAPAEPVISVKPIHTIRAFDDSEFYTGTYSKSLPYMPSALDIATPRVENNTFTVSPSASSTLTFDRRSMTSALIAGMMMIVAAFGVRKVLVAA